VAPAVPEVAVQVPEVPELEVEVLEVAVQVPEALEVAVRVPEVLEVAVQVPEVPEVPEVVVLEVAVQVAEALEVAVRVPEVLEVAVQVPEVQVAAQVAEAPVRAEAVRVARPVQGRPEWAAAQVESLGPAWAVAQRVPVEAAPLAALAHRVRSVHRTLPALPAPALPQEVAQPVRRRRMAWPQVGQGQDRRAPRTGHGAPSWRALPAIRRRSAPSSCVPCTSGAISSRASRTALRLRTASNCRSTFAANANCVTRRQRIGG
jgi:hypothetical protein